MAVDGVVTQSSTGIDGNAYTSSVSNDQLTSEDFLMLMLEEMKMQDPTKPMDSQQLMDSQLKMSTIESNLNMAEAMQSLEKSYAASALSTAANLIDRIIEDGSTNDVGDLSSYTVSTVENVDGELYVNAYEITGIVDALKNSDTDEYVLYDADGYIYEADGETQTEYRVALDASGRFSYNSDGTIKILNKDNEVVTDEAVTSLYAYAGSAFSYAEETTKIPVSNITEVR